MAEIELGKIATKEGDIFQLQFFLCFFGLSHQSFALFNAIKPRSRKLPTRRQTKLTDAATNVENAAFLSGYQEAGGTEGHIERCPVTSGQGLYVFRIKLVKSFIGFKPLAMFVGGNQRKKRLCKITC